MEECYGMPSCGLAAHNVVALCLQCCRYLHVCVLVAMCLPYCLRCFLFQ